MRLIICFVISVYSLVLYSQSMDKKVSYGSEQDSEVCIAVNPKNPRILISTWNNFNYDNNWNIPTVHPGYNFSFDSGDSWPNTFVSGRDYIHPPYEFNDQVNEY